MEWFAPHRVTLSLVCFGLLLGMGSGACHRISAIEEEPDDNDGQTDSVDSDTSPPLDTAEDSSIFGYWRSIEAVQEEINTLGVTPQRNGEAVLFVVLQGEETATEVKYQHEVEIIEAKHLFRFKMTCVDHPLLDFVMNCEMFDEIELHCTGSDAFENYPALNWIRSVF